MTQPVKILLIVIVISLSFWLLNSQFLGGGDKVNNPVKRQDQSLSTPERKNNSQQAAREIEATRDQSSLITTAPIRDDAGQRSLSDDQDGFSEHDESVLGGIDHILTEEEKQAMMHLAPEAGDDGSFGEPPEFDDSGTYSDGPGGIDIITGDGIESGLSLEESSFPAEGLQGEIPQNGDSIFSIPPEGNQ